MLKKTSADVKKRVVFRIVSSLIFREKATKSHAKWMKTILVHKNQQNITRRTLFLSKKPIFSEFWGPPWVLPDLLGPPGKFPKSFFFLIHGQLRLITTVDGLREASGRTLGCFQAPPGGASRRPQGMILHRFWNQFCTSETNQKCKKCRKFAGPPVQRRVRSWSNLPCCKISI